MLKNNGVAPRATGSYHWLEYMPGYAYYFLPSFKAHEGAPLVYSYEPEFLKDFLFDFEIEEVLIVKKRTTSSSKSNCASESNVASVKYDNKSKEKAKRCEIKFMIK